MSRWTRWCLRLQHARLLCPPLSPGVCSNSCPWSEWCYVTISSSASPFPFVFNLSQYQSLFQWDSSSHHVAKVLELQLQYQSFHWIFSGIDWLISFRIDWFDLRDSQGSSPAPEFESINYLVLSILYGPTLTSIHDYWKNHSFNYMDLCQQNDVSDF